MATFCVILLLFTPAIVQVKSDLVQDLDSRLRIVELKLEAQSYEIGFLKKELQNAEKEISVLQQRLENMPDITGKHKDMDPKEVVHDKTDTKQSGILDADKSRKCIQLVDHLMTGFKDEKQLRNKFEHMLKEKYQTDFERIRQETSTSIDTLANELKTVKEDSEVCKRENLKNYEGLKVELTEKTIRTSNTTNKELQHLKDVMETMDDVRQHETKEFQSQLNSVKSEVQLLGNSVASVVRKQGHQVAFSAQVSPSYADLEPWQTILFKNILTNIGNGLSATTGDFTATIPGVYVFFVHIMGKEGNMEVCLRVNGNKKLLLYTSLGRKFGLDSNMLVVRLKQNDKVHVAKHGAYGSRPFYVHHAWSTFSGFLLYPD